MNNPRYVHHYHSPVVGWLELTVSDTGVRSISYVDPPRSIKKLNGNPLMDMLVDQLDRYFRGDLATFTVPVDFDQCTPFRQKVWKEIARIPYGETRSYAELAAAVGNPRAARAVGSSNGENPVPIVIPCHRVIRADGSLGGYSSGIRIKRALLELEGVNASWPSDEP